MLKPQTALFGGVLATDTCDRPTKIQCVHAVQPHLSRCEVGCFRQKPVTQLRTFCGSVSMTPLTHL